MNKVNRFLIFVFSFIVFFFKPVEEKEKIKQLLVVSAFLIYCADNIDIDDSNCVIS